MRMLLSVEFLCKEFTTKLFQSEDFLLLPFPCLQAGCITTPFTMGGGIFKKVKVCNYPIELDFTFKKYILISNITQNELVNQIQQKHTLKKGGTTYHNFFRFKNIEKKKRYRKFYSGCFAAIVLCVRCRT